MENVCAFSGVIPVAVGIAIAAVLGILEPGSYSKSLLSDPCFPCSTLDPSNVPSFEQVVRVRSAVGRRPYEQRIETMVKLNNVASLLGI